MLFAEATTNIYDALVVAIPGILAFLSSIIMGYLNNKKTGKAIEATDQNKEAIHNVKNEINDKIQILTDIKEKVVSDANIIESLDKISISEVFKITDQLDEIWLYLKNRAIAEAASIGLLYFNNNQLIVAEKAKEWYKDFLPELKNWYNTNKQLNEIDLFKDCHNKFGEKLVKEICQPYSIFAGSCIQIAILLAKE